MAVSGSSIEIQLSNAWSITPTTFGSVTVGTQQAGATIVTGSIVPVTFGGSRAVNIPTGGSVTSDPITLAVHPGESLAFSLSVVGAASVSVHFCCSGRIDSYATGNGGGDQTANPAATAFTFSDGFMRWLSAVMVAGSPARGTVVAFGDSITEGFANTGFGWPTALQSRISQLAPTEQVTLANEGISGNTLTVFPPNASYAASSGGIPGVTRFGPDALSVVGVKDIVLFLGTNDIWFGAGGEGASPIPPYGTAPAIEAGMQTLIAQAHAAGVKIFGVTLLPRASSANVPNEKPEVWTPADQATLTAVNAWILAPTSGFDGVINLAAVMGDVYNGACLPDTPFAPYYTADNLHPNTAGQTVMADAIPTPLFGIPEAPQVPQPVAVTPTPGCPGAVTAEQVLALGRAPAPPTVAPSTVAPSTSVPSTSPPSTQPVRHTVPSGTGKRTVAVLVGVGIIAIALIVLLLVFWRRRSIRRRRRGRYPNRLNGLGAHSPGAAALAGMAPKSGDDLIQTPAIQAPAAGGSGPLPLDRPPAEGSDTEESAPHSG
jgi:lysophospholipase L1-like esterase